MLTALMAIGSARTVMIRSHPAHTGIHPGKVRVRSVSRQERFLYISQTRNGVVDQLLRTKEGAG